MGSPATLGFAGTPEFAVPSLEALLASGHDVAWVLTQPDRAAGRGRRLTAAPVKQGAAAAGVAVAQPENLREQSALHGLRRPDLVVVVAYGLMLPRWFREWPRLGCVNVHASLLPRWRGAAPIQRALLAGDTRTGISLMQIVARLDAGPVYAAEALEIAAGETAGELQARLAALGARLLGGRLEALLAGQLAALAQDEAEVSYAPKLAKGEAVIDWMQSALAIERQVRAFNPWPVAESALTDGRRLRIWRAVAIPRTVAAPPGTVVEAGAEGIEVATGQGVLRLLEVQAPGARVVTAGQFLHAQRLAGIDFVGPG
jgi:methionyl-tRNA formyltransferase